MPRIALVTCRALPEPDHDEGPLLAALRSAGVVAEMLAWDDPAADPSRFDLCVIRSTWNYHLAPEAFLAWIDRAAAQTTVLNPPAIVRWNHHKRYLLEIASRGIPIVPSRILERGSPAQLPAVVDAFGTRDIVIKPAVSASSYMTKRFTPDQSQEAQSFLDAMLAARDALVQPFMPAVQSHGEISIMSIDGSWTHAVLKHPRFAGEEERVERTHKIPEAALELAERVLQPYRNELLYARVDLIRNEEEALCISELELIEPSLFLEWDASACQTVVRGIVGRTSADVSSNG